MSQGSQSESAGPLNVSVVIPVYRGEDTLGALMTEFAPLTQATATPEGRSFRIAEVLLVWDRGPGRSDQVIRELAQEHAWIKPIWLSRNFGQHAATLAGMTSSGGDWIVTMDEDGQHDPAYIASMIDAAYDAGAQLVYGSPTNPPPHSTLRNLGSKTAKRLFTNVLADSTFADFSSYRLVLGEIGRSVAAYTGNGVYLDVALSWVVADVTTCPILARQEGREAENYNYRRLFSHFGRLVISSGTKPLAIVSWLGIFFVLIGGLVSIWVLSQRIFGDLAVTGWASTFVALMVIGGAILLSLGVVAQYVGAATNMSLGKPLYVVVRDPAATFDPRATQAPDHR
ncbi:MAG: glycosyltransferase [Candidatus Nanopelagicales bacterium]|nr:glycosyltransferase [Candidatus Nanopelagicales bacterium]